MSDVGNCMQAATTPFAETSHMRPDDGVSSKDKHMEPISYASLLNSEPRGKKANFRALDNTETVEGADLAIPMANGRSSYARALIEITSDQELKESLVVAIPKHNGIGHTMENIRIKYEWKPPRCDACKIFGHANDQCPKSNKVTHVNDKSKEGSTNVTRKGGKEKVKTRLTVTSRHVDGVRLRGTSTSHGINILDSDYDEVEHVFDETGTYMELISSSNSTNPKGASTPVDVVSNSHVASSYLDKYTYRRDLWQDLGAHKAILHGKPWCLLSDFNSALNLEDHAFGTSLIDISMREFKECVEVIDVSNVNKSGLHCTWNQKPKGDHGVLNKIDRIMANLDFHDVFIVANALFQPYHISDHSPAILRFPNRSKFHPKPFKFSNLLVFHGKFSDVVVSSWEMAVDGYDMFQVGKKLKALKKPLKKLLQDKGNLHERVKSLRFELNEAQKALDRDPSNVMLREEEASYLQAFNEALLDEEIFLKQRSKVEWLRVGDSNSAYFHNVVKSRVSWSRIDRVLDMHGNCFEGNTAQEAFIAHFTNFLGQNGTTTELNDMELYSNKLSNTEAAYMIRDVTNKEIKETIFSMSDDKSLGPDGYTAAFFKGAWEIVGVDISNVVREFFVTEKLLKEVNHTITALILKMSFPTRVNDYRPISCCNVLFKCISKIISNHIKDCLTDLLMHNYHLDRGPPRCGFKVNIQKGYDTVDWNFLKKILLGFGFQTHMVSWIMKCVSSTSFSVSLNVSLYGFFKGKSGLRQGDPLSPYLFTLVMEILSLILKRKVRNSEDFVFHHHFSSLDIINLCFTDDLFLFAHGDVNSARVIMDALDEFKSVSGLVPSLPKSTAYFCNVLNHTKLAILNVLPFEEGTLPVKYLGVPLVSTRLVYRDCKELVEKVQDRVGNWKKKFISFAGCLQLVQSVISSMHVYWSLVFILPSRILMDIEQLMRGFLYCPRDIQRGKAKVAWEDVCLPKSEGGLGIQSLEIFNVALITSHVWSILTSKESLWVKWIHTHKLCGYNFWDFPFRGSMTWGWRKLLQIRPTIHKFIWYKLGDSSVRYNLDSKVADLIVHNNWTWPNAWETRYPNIFFSTVPCLSNSNDKVIWKDRLGMEKSFFIDIVWEDIRPQGYIVDWLILLARKRSVQGVIAKLVFVASTYFIWQERNGRLACQSLDRAVGSTIGV
ncbi:hypothetical protein Tco_0500302 [Tanacetum coccineum]